jgi:hypothetical protein
MLIPCSTPHLTSAKGGYNVYVEARSVRPGRPDERGRGKIESTIGCFAFVVDRDGDRGKSGHVNGDASVVVETSPGNFHEWLFLDRALDAGDAKPLGEMIRKATGTDSDTGVVTQPYRVRGTPNYPDAKSGLAAASLSRLNLFACPIAYGRPTRSRPHFRLSQSLNPAGSPAVRQMRTAIPQLTRAVSLA